jgi:hypothetical protein
VVITYSSGYTASTTRCSSIFDPERKFIAANRELGQTMFSWLRISPTPYTPCPGSERNRCPDVNLLDEQGYEGGNVKRGDTVPQDTKSLEE